MIGVNWYFHSKSGFKFFQLKMIYLKKVTIEKKIFISYTMEFSERNDQKFNGY